MSHQMTWYILAHMPYFHRPSHICTICNFHACLFNETCDMVASNFLTELANSYQCISLVTAIALLCELY